ncbi:MAG: VOC family protein [Planctomycetes bacterium]|nr:VOC family protein [Planctomycetota bacterium]MBI3843743.1 VOC family protein [Planctomycetota bacterium]
MKTIRMTALALCLSVSLRTVGDDGRVESPVVAIDAIGLTVADADRSIEFFSNVLSFEKVSDVEVAGDDWEHLEGVFGLRMRVVRMKLGDESIELQQYIAPEGRPFPADTRANDRWFQHVAIVTSDMARAYATLREHHVRHASSGPQKLPDWNPNAGGIEAFYFRDPDGHYLEVIHFPAGKSDPKWQRLGAGEKPPLFLGIDHTAIVVANTDSSLAFYHDSLGLRVAGASENYGTEQEHLNNVFGARLRITALRAERGPGIELLEYLAPRDGRPASDVRLNDIAHWQTRLVSRDVDALTNDARRHVAFVSAGVVALPVPPSAFARRCIIRDPDGHAMELAQE